MAKSSARKSLLKSLFSKSEAGLAAPTDKDADKDKDKDEKEKEKKKFKLFKFRTKSKGGSASGKPAGEPQQPDSAAVLSTTTEDEEDCADEIVSTSKSSLYATAPRSKNKDFSYSELDLRKPKRFATFSLGIKKKKKKYEDDISKSTFGLHGPGLDDTVATSPTPLDLSQNELDRSKINRILSISQPELDTSNKFDIPSPPPVATNPFEFTPSRQLKPEVTLTRQPEAEEPLKNFSDHSDVLKEPQKAPIATIPELQLDYEDPSAQKELIPAQGNSSRSVSPAPTTRTETPPAADGETLPVLQASHPPVVPDTTDHTVAVADSIFTSNIPSDYIPQQSNTESENPLAESNRVRLSHLEPDTPEAAYGPTGKTSLASVDPEIDTTDPESTPDSASVPVKVSGISGRSSPGTVTTSSAVSREKSPRPVNEEEVYGALYESLFPESFTSEVLSSLLNPPTQIRTKVGHLKTNLEPVTIRTLDEYHQERPIYSRVSTETRAGIMDDAIGGYSNRYTTNRIYTSESSSFTSYQTSNASETRRDPDIHQRYPSSSLLSSSEPLESKNIAYSEVSNCLSEEKSDRFSPIPDTARSSPVVQISAPPIYDYTTSQGTDTRVTDSTRRVILVKELVTDETGAADAAPTSPVPGKMSTAKRLEMNTETSAPPGELDGRDGLVSPTYLSVGSDDGSAMEIYYSAEEDNGESGDEEYAMDKREIYVAHMGKEVVQNDESPQQVELAERFISRTDEGNFRGIIVQTMVQEEKLEEGTSQTEVQQQLKSGHSETHVQATGTSWFLEGSNAKSLMNTEASAEFPQVKEEGREKRKEELLATPVQQVNTPDFALPSSELHGQQESSKEIWAKELETEDHPDGEQRLPGQERGYLSDNTDASSEWMHAAARNARERDAITPKCSDAEEQVSLIADADKTREVSKESPQTNSKAATSAGTDTFGDVAFTRSTALQSDAVVAKYNKAPQSSEWVDTITQSADRIRAAPQQVAVGLSATTTDAIQADTEATEGQSESPEHPAGAQLDPIQGSMITSGTRTATSEVFASENQQTQAHLNSEDKMNSGYGTLRAKLSSRLSYSLKEDDSKQFHQVSEISEADATEADQDTLDSSERSTAVIDLNKADSQYRWKNRFEGVTQYKPPKTDDSSLSYRMSDTCQSSPSLSSSLPETSAYDKYLGNAFSSSSPLEEGVTAGNRLSDSGQVYLQLEGEPAGEQKGEWRRSSSEQEEPAAPAGEREPQSLGETDRLKSRWEEPQLPASCFPRSLQEEEEEEEESNSTRFTGVFQATLVELDCDPAPLPSAPPASPDTESLSQFDMDNLVDTLKSMGPSFRPRTTGIRSPAPVLVSSLPPIVEDASSPATADVPASAAPTNKTEGNAGLYTLPVDLGLRSSRDTRSPLELMKENQLQDQQQARGLNSPLRTGINSSSLRKSSDSPFEDLQSQMLNGNGGSPSSSSSSRLGNSVIFGGHRSAAGDAASEKRPVHRSLFQTSSLPETGLRNNRASVGSKELETGPKKDPAGTRFERISFILNSTTNSLTGGEEPNICVSRPPQSSISPPASNSPSRLLSPTGSIDLHWPFATTDSPLSMFSQVQGMGMGVGAGRVSNPVLQRSYSGEGSVGVQPTSLFNSVPGGSQFQSQECEPENNFSSKYRAFPDAYLTKEKDHGKLNPRPGKIFIFDRPGLCGQRIEVRSDVVDATQWELQETISIRVVRGGWVLYEKRNFKGEKIALDEGDIELTCPFSPPEEQLQNGHQEGKEQNGEKSDAQTEVRPTRRFIIGSIRRAVRDYSVPEISLFPEENAEGKKVVFRDTSEDARIFGFPIKANSVIINAGLWLVYAHPFFQGIPRVLEVGGYINPAAWGVEKPYVGSLHPLKIGEPRVENMSEPQLVIYDRAYFTGKSRTIYSNMRDFMTRTDRQQSVFMYSVGSIKVVGGIWVGYEKEGFRGHQYLLEEGEYHDWRVWGGCNSELRSVRVIRADLTDPLMVMFEMPEEDQEGVQEGNTFEVTEAIPDVELFEYKTLTRSIHVLSGAWIAYSHVDFSGNQYILEKGFYNNCADWGSQDNRICSVQPILTAHGTDSRVMNKVILYSEPDFQGKCQVFDRNQESVSEKLLTKSCRVSGGSWVFYEEKQFSGNLYVLSEGDYPNLTSMGCTPTFTICSIKAVPMMFSVPSISLFGLECLEGREITTETEILSMVEEGFNNLILSIKVNSGCWVVCEHSNYRGRQFLLEPIEITNWLKFSSLQTVGSMFPVRQRRRFFRIKNKEQGHFMSVQGGVEEMKSGRVVVSPEAEPMSDVWFYQDGFIKNKLSQTMSLQVMGNIEPGTKVVLWTETREPVQSWTAQMTGLISSLTFPGMVLDVKGGKTYDKDHVVIMPENEERPSQQWEIELL